MNPKPLVALKNFTVPIAMITACSIWLRPSHRQDGAYETIRNGRSAVRTRRAPCESGQQQCASTDGTPSHAPYNPIQSRKQVETSTESMIPQVDRIDLSTNAHATPRHCAC